MRKTNRCVGIDDTKFSSPESKMLSSANFRNPGLLLEDECLNAYIEHTIGGRIKGLQSRGISDQLIANSVSDGTREY